MTDEATTKRNALRMLGALYRLSRGEKGLPVSMDDLLDECIRENLLGCSDEQFEEYRTRSLDEVKEWRRLNRS